MSLEECRKRRISEKYRKMTEKKKINEFYNNKARVNKIIYEYRKLAEVRPVYRVLNSLSSRINAELKELGIKREFTYTQILGCSVKDFEEYLLNKMTEGMSYDNYGVWVVDHIIPFSSFDFNNLDQIKTCCHYTNLQPLWKLDNLKKYNKLSP